VETKTYFYIAPGQKYNGKLRRVERDGQIQIEYRYDRKTGLPSEIRDASGVISYYEYPQEWHPHDPLMQPKPIRILRSHPTTRAEKEIVAEYGYNELGQMVISRDGATGQITKYSYTSKGELQSVVGQDGTTSFTYDAFGHRTSVTHDKIKESVEYDDAGRVKSRIAADGVKTDFTYTKTGQVATVTRGGKLVLENLYDPQGKQIGEKDSLGRVRKIERDIKGNLLSETAPNGSVTRYTYDDAGRRTAQIDGNGNKISFDYDPQGHLIRQSNPLGETLSWSYDGKGRLTSRSNGEQTIKYLCDPAGRVNQLDYGNSDSVSYQYNPEGKILSAVTPETQSDIFYDKLGRPEASISSRNHPMGTQRHSFAMGTMPEASAPAS
jgi:YD repeat-containing protein